MFARPCPAKSADRSSFQSVIGAVVPIRSGDNEDEAVYSVEQMEKKEEQGSGGVSPSMWREQGDREHWDFKSRE